MNGYRFPCWPLLAALYAVALSASAANVPPRDIAGSRDNPIVSRFAGSVIVGYRQADYDALTLPLGKYRDGKFSPSESVEGRLTQIAYVAPAGKTGLEVFRNYQQALAAAGFKVRYSCAGSDGADGCGRGYAVASALTDDVIEAMGSDYSSLMIDTLDATNGNVRVLTAKLERSEGNVDLDVLVSQADNQPVGVMLQMVEGKAMATDQVKVDARAMGQGLAQAGHIALYGIHFASDSATLQPDSDATLAEMAKLLQAQPALKVWIVGHTDTSGSLAHNLALSQQRAEAVVKALTARYKVATGRLAAKGMGPYAPVASNRNDAGKAKNRRVEMVEQ